MKKLNNDKKEVIEHYNYFYNLQNHPTFHSKDRLVNIVRGRECFISLYLNY